jgi:metallopeptidase MepB
MTDVNVLTGSPRSKVCAEDLFVTAFKEDPMNILAGKRYRSIILEPGSSRPEVVSLELFLGRRPNNDAYDSEVC